MDEVSLNRIVQREGGDESEVKEGDKPTKKDGAENFAEKRGQQQVKTEDATSGKRVC